MPPVLKLKVIACVFVGVCDFIKAKDVVVNVV